MFQTTNQIYIYIYIYVHTHQYMAANCTSKYGLVSPVQSPRLPATSHVHRTWRTRVRRLRWAPSVGFPRGDPHIERIHLAIHNRDYLPKWPFFHIFHMKLIHIYLVVYLLLWQKYDFVTWDGDIANWMEKHNSCSKAPTSLYLEFWINLRDILKWYVRDIRIFLYIPNIPKYKS